MRARKAKRKTVISLTNNYLEANLFAQLELELPRGNRRSRMEQIEEEKSTLEPMPIEIGIVKTKESDANSGP